MIRSTDGFSTFLLIRAFSNSHGMLDCKHHHGLAKQADIISRTADCVLRANRCVRHSDGARPFAPQCACIGLGELLRSTLGIEFSLRPAHCISALLRLAL